LSNVPTDLLLELAKHIAVNRGEDE